MMMICMVSATPGTASRRLAAGQSRRAALQLFTWIAASLALLAMTKVKVTAGWYERLSNKLFRRCCEIMSSRTAIAG